MLSLKTFRETGFEGLTAQNILLNMENRTKSTVSQRIERTCSSEALARRDNLQLHKMRSAFERKGTGMFCGSNKAQGAEGNKSQKMLLRCIICRKAIYAPRTAKYLAGMSDTRTFALVWSEVQSMRHQAWGHVASMGKEVQERTDMVA